MKTWAINMALVVIGLGLSLWLRRRQRMNADATYRQQLAAWQAKPPHIAPMKVPEDRVQKEA